MASRSRRLPLTEQPPSYPPPPPGGYGYPSSPEDGYGYPPRRAGMNGMAIASLVCSLLGWLCGIGPILGIIFGVLALNKIKETGQGGRGLAIAGIAIGAVLIVFGIIGGILSLVSGGFEEHHHYSG